MPPHGPPVSHAFLVQPDPNGIPIQTALAAIDAVHGDGVLPPIVAYRGAASQQEGHYRCYGSGYIEIEVSISASAPALTTAHEVGHFLDDQGIGPPGTLASQSNQLLFSWRQASFSSGAVQTLLRMKAGNIQTIPVRQGLRTLPIPVGKNLPYWVSERELFARSYAQYIALKSQDPTLMAELSRRQGTLINQSVPLYWYNADFAPIGKAFDQLFTQIGWIR